MLIAISIGFQIQRINGDSAKLTGKISLTTTAASAIFLMKKFQEKNAADLGARETQKDWVG